MKEFIRRVRMPHRRGGEFRDSTCLKTLSNRFSFKISVVDSMKKLLEVLRSSFEDCIALARHESCPFYHAVFDANANDDFLNFKWIEKDNKAILDEQLHEKTKIAMLT